MEVLSVYIFITLLLPFLCSAIPVAPPTISGLLASGFKGDIIINGQPGFANATEPWSFNYVKDPKLALLPNTANDVSLAIKWLNKLSLDFAVRAGGAAGSQSDGVILSLANLNKVDYVASEGVLHLVSTRYCSGRSHSARRRWWFTLGGGISYLMNRHGLASDSIVDAQVVLADGSIKWAKDDPELMFALRAPVIPSEVPVTELIVKAYPKPTEVFSGFVGFPFDQFEAIKENVVNLTQTNTDPNVSLLLAVIAINGEPVVLVNPIIYGTEAFAKAALPWVWELPGAILDTTASITWEQLQDVQLQFVHHPAETSNYQQHNVVVKNLTSEVIQSAVDWQLSILSDPRWSGVQILFEPFVPGAFSTHATKGSWPHSSPNVGIVEIFIEQLNATSGDAEVNEAQLRAGATIVENGSPASDYYADNLPTLQAIKKKFDPRNRFNKNIPIARS
ncbi:hypothetical protein BDQ17DRAFT_1368771 [Cyathus striatus]|nr:hypothetical protein BDQ17DRAFT_1368771 [Cyathus striatus]